MRTKIKPEIRVRKLGSSRFRKNGLVKVHNKSFDYAYKSEMDLLKRDWEAALERHSERHPVTFNGSLWTTTSQARRLADQRAAPKKALCRPMPLRQRRQVLKITKVKDYFQNKRYTSLAVYTLFLKLPSIL